MKLIFCSTCNQVFNLSHTYTECKGGHGGGQYVNDIDAKVWGDPHKIFVLGFANSSFISAVRAQISQGDLPADFGYGGRIVSKGRDFTAFVIPESAPSIIRVDERFDPIIVDKSSY
jgi:hypothetical protein